jgi:hypothetical protein
LGAAFLDGYPHVCDGNSKTEERVENARQALTFHRFLIVGG